MPTPSIRLAVEPDAILTGPDLPAVFQFVLEDYSLSDILDDISKDDLRCLRLRCRPPPPPPPGTTLNPAVLNHICTPSLPFRGGVLCRVWRAIQRHRERQRSSECAEDRV